MKRYLALLLLVIVVVSVVSAAGVATTTAAPKKLATPKLVAPRNGAVYSAGATGGLIAQEFTWKAVSGAVRYHLESQISKEGKWTLRDDVSTVGTNFQLRFRTPLAVGSYRWHVTALSADPSLNSAPSAWRYFTVR